MRSSSRPRRSRRCCAGSAPIALLRNLRADARAFNRAKAFAVAGLTLGFLLWQLGFMTIGGEWFGMWQSKSWDGVPSAFRFVMVIMAVLIFVVLPDGEAEPRVRLHIRAFSAAIKRLLRMSTFPNGLSPSAFLLLQKLRLCVTPSR